MLILKSTDTSLDVDTRNALTEIRQLAKQIVCHCEDMEFTERRTNLMRLPIRLLPQTAIDLNKIFHKEMVRTVCLVAIYADLSSKERLYFQMGGRERFFHRELHKPRSPDTLAPGR